MAAGGQTGRTGAMPTRADPGMGFGPSAPLRWRLALFAAVFFTFAPVWTLSIASMANRPSDLGLVIMGLISGLTGVGYAMSATVTPKVLFLVIPVHVLSILFLNALHPEWIGMSAPRASIEGLVAVLSIAAGYTLFVWYIAGEGARSLRLRTELALAQQIHETLAPAIQHTDERLEVSGVSLAGSEMGGDLVDLVVGDGWTDVYVADVSGHGVRAGVVMAMVKSAIRALVTEGPDLGRLLADLNRVLCDLTPDHMFATFACLRVHDDGRAEVALAGHLPILVHRAADGSVERVGNDSLPLGVAPVEGFESRPVTLAPGDMVAIYTDGLMETASPEGEMLGLDGVERAFAEAAASGPDEARRAVMDRVAAYGDQRDDQTLAIVRVAGQAPPG